MKFAAAILLVSMNAWAADPAPAPAAEAPKAEAPKEAAAKPAAAGMTEDQKTFYALGFFLGGKLGPFAITAAEMKHVEAGLRDSVLGKKPQVDINTYGPKINDIATARASKKAEGRKKADKAAVEKLGKEEGAKVMKSGLIFKELKAGTGPQPTADDSVKCHYEGKLVDGTVFDSSVARGEPATFPLKGVIPCWTEGVPMIKTGGKARLVCPSDIAYGDEGRPPTIPGGATLIFEVELLEIVKK